MNFVCNNCGAFSNDYNVILVSSNVFSCEECHKKTIIVLMNEEEFTEHCSMLESDRIYNEHLRKVEAMEKKELEFCQELTELLLKYGYGIADEPHIFELKTGSDSDYGRTASINEEGKLEFR